MVPMHLSTVSNHLTDRGRLRQFQVDVPPELTACCDLMLHFAYRISISWLYPVILIRFGQPLKGFCGYNNKLFHSRERLVFSHFRRDAFVHSS